MKTEELKFPVIAHHRIVVTASARDDAAMQRLFSGFDLAEREHRAKTAGRD